MTATELHRHIEDDHGQPVGDLTSTLRFLIQLHLTLHRMHPTLTHTHSDLRRP